VEKPIFCDINIPHEELPDDGERVLLCKLFPLLEEVFEISLVAELSDDVAVVGSAEDVVALEDVGVVQLLQRLDFALQHALLGLALDGPDVDDLHRHSLLGLVVGAAVDHRAEAAPDHVLEAVGVVLYLLAQIVARVRLVEHSN
jgi:hypothetical protein